LPAFIKLKNTTFTLRPTRNQDTGSYSIELRLSDGQKEQIYNLKVIVEKLPSKPLYVQRAKRAQVKILKISRDAELDLQLFTQYNLANLTNAIHSNTFNLVIMKEKPLNVPYQVQSRDNETGEITLKLNLTGIKQISRAKVIYSSPTSFRRLIF